MKAGVRQPCPAAAIWMAPPATRYLCGEIRFPVTPDEGVRCLEYALTSGDTPPKPSVLFG